MLPPSQVENDSKDDHMQEQDQADGPQILIPPPEIKSWADESARFIASVRPFYEKKIIAENAGSPEYSFLNVDDPYHAYYKNRLSELRAQNGSVDDDSYLWLKEVRKSMTGNKKKITTREWMTELKKRHERYLESLGAAIYTTFASPFTGELIPAYQILQHLLEPKYKEQKERLFATIMEATSAQDDKIFSCIAWLARTRPHVFGTTEEEFANAVKTEIESTKLELDRLESSVVQNISLDAQCSTPA